MRKQSPELGIEIRADSMEGSYGDKVDNMGYPLSNSAHTQDINTARTPTFA